VNDNGIIRRNPKVTAINSAIEVDLTGQVCADSIGGKIYSGVCIPPSIFFVTLFQFLGELLYLKGGNPSLPSHLKQRGEKVG
jgi:hypothetical protein